MAKVSVSIKDYWFLELDSSTEADVLLEHYKILGIKAQYEYIFSPTDNLRAMFWVGKKTDKIKKLLDKYSKPIWKNSDKLPTELFQQNTAAVLPNSDAKDALNAKLNKTSIVEEYIVKGKKPKTKRNAKQAKAEAIRKNLDKCTERMIK